MRISDWSSDVCSSDLRLRSMIARRLHKSCRRIDRARRADGNEQISLGQRLIDPLHFIWHFAEEHDVRPQLRRSAVTAYRSKRHVAFPFHRIATCRTQGGLPLAMPMQHPRSEEHQSE